MSENEIAQKLEEYASILKDLKAANVIRTYNSPIGDYAEWLVSNTLGLKLEENSKKGYDAIDENSGEKYQIKSRWFHQGKNSNRLNVIRNYDDNQFKYLIIVIFEKNFTVKEAYKVEHDVIKKYFDFNEYQRGYIVSLKKEFLEDEGVVDITDRFRSA